MKRTVTYVRRYYKALSVEVDLDENLSDDEIVDYLDGLKDNWNKVADQSLEFEDNEILIEISAGQNDEL